jgi:hypothetical protein
MEISLRAFSPKSASLFTRINYLDSENPIGLPRNKHLQRLEGVGHNTLDYKNNNLVG